VLVRTSTTGVSPVTTIVSCTVPTRRSALIAVTPLPVSCTSRVTVVNPCSVNLSA
jgi:hypothetical protein